MRARDTTILIIQHDPGDRTLIEMAFRAIGVTGPICAVSNGLQAIEYLLGEGAYAERERFPYPSFILTDLKMPHADGFDLLLHLKNNPQWATIPAVVLTASSDPDDIKQAYRLGASGYHVKPNTFDQLARQLKLLHNYWSTCHVPEADFTSQHLTAKRAGKLGQTRGEQKRVKAQVRRRPCGPRDY